MAAAMLHTLVRTILTQQDKAHSKFVSWGCVTQTLWADVGQEVCAGSVTADTFSKVSSDKRAACVRAAITEILAIER
jgi:hypothetical protein